MPTVPTYEPQVREQGLPNVRVSTNAPEEAFGAGASRVMDASQKAFGQFHDVMKAEKEKADEIAATEAYTQALRKKNELLYDPNAGAMTRKGKDAFGVSEEYGTAFDEFADGVEEKLGNSEQRSYFQKMRSRVRLDLDENLGRHTFQEGQRYEEDVFKSTIDTLADDTIQNYHVPNKVKENIGLMRKKIESFGAQRGMPPEWITDQVNQTAASAHAGIIDRMLANGQDSVAQAHYDQVKNTVTFGKLATSIEAKLEDGTTRGQTQRIVSTLMSQYTDLGTARRALKEMSLPSKIQDASDDRLRAEFGFREKETYVNKAQNFNLAFQSLAAVQKQNGVVHFEDIPLDIVGKMTPAEQKEAKSLVSKMNSPESVKHDPTVYTQYSFMPQQKLANVQMGELIAKVYPNVDEASWNNITQKWQAAVDAKTNYAKDVEAKEIYNHDDILLAALRSVPGTGIKEADTKADIMKSEAKASAFNHFEIMAKAQWAAFAKSNGGKITDEQKQEIVKKLSIKKVFVDKSWSIDKEVPLAALTDEETGRAYFPANQIPKADKATMINEYQGKRSKKPSTRTIERMYAAFLAGRKDLYEQIMEQN